VQVSAPLQALPSSGQVTGVCVHPVVAPHASFVHTFPSLQSGAGPPTQVPPWQVSPVVHVFPSLHEVPSASGSLTQPNTGSQLLAVQGLASTHPAGLRVRQWMSQVEQAGGSHCSGNSS